MNGKTGVSRIPVGRKYAQIVLGRKLMLQSRPPLAAKTCRRCALSRVKTWVDIGIPNRTPSLIQLMMQPMASGTIPAPRTGRHHRRRSSPPRPDANHIAAKPMAITTPQPIVLRDSVAARVRAPATATLLVDGRSRTPSNANSAAMPVAMPQAMSSL